MYEFLLRLVNKWFVRCSEEGGKKRKSFPAKHFITYGNAAVRQLATPRTLYDSVDLLFHDISCETFMWSNFRAKLRLNECV